jgi:hypothetical protein
MAAPTVYSRRFAIAVGVFLLGATGFSSPPHRLSRTASSFSTVLGMNKPRRSVLGWIRKAVLTTAGVSTVSKTLSSPEAFADETNAGKIVEFTLNNLDGEIGKVGTVKIQLQPDWAPKGVARFEVSFVYFFQYFLSISWGFYSRYTSLCMFRSSLRSDSGTIVGFSVFYQDLCVSLESMEILLFSKNGGGRICPMIQFESRTNAEQLSSQPPVQIHEPRKSLSTRVNRAIRSWTSRALRPLAK